MPLIHRIKVLSLILLWLIIVVNTSIMIWLPVTLFGLWVLYAVYPRFDLTPSISLKSTCKLIALTFDDGPTPGFTDKILEILKAASIPATFFMIGSKIEQAPELARIVVSSGNEIGVHTYTHKKLHLADRKKIDSEISRTREIIRSIYKSLNMEKDLRDIFRAPHGFKSLTLKKYLREKGIALIPWTKGVWDTDAPGTKQILERATQNPSVVEVLLLHDGKGMSTNITEAQKNGVIDALPKIIDFYKNNGYTFIRVSELVKGDDNTVGSFK